MPCRPCDKPPAFCVKRPMRAALAAWLLLSWCGTLPIAAAEQADASTPAKPPHLLVILVDDLGWGDLSCYGAEDLHTPHIDGLVARGMRFDNFYANCPVCSPTRASLLTGRYPELAGVPGVIRTHAENSWGFFDPAAVTLPDLLRKAGYHTALVGKWHLGLESPNTPMERGFDHFHGFLGDMMDDYYDHRRHGINYMRLGDREIHPQGHATDLFSDWACDYLRHRAANEAEGRRQPFFLFLCYNAPHTPIQPPQEWLEKVTAREPGIAPVRASLAALIEHMDDGIGRVLRTLEETGLAGETLVVFTSDNGGQVNVGARNGPHRAGKGTVYEGGLKVPACAVWPGKIAAGTRTAQIALTMDLYPTLCEAAGIAVEHEIDGRSFLPTLLGKASPADERQLFFHRREGGAPFFGQAIQAVRHGDWKLVRNSPFLPLELYNLRDDPLEEHNLADAQRQKLLELSRALQAHTQQAGSVPWQPPRRAALPD